MSDNADTDGRVVRCFPCASLRIISTNSHSIVNVYFRHERGAAFAIYSTVYTIATVAGASFCGFIIQHTYWSANFWWLTGGNSLAAILVFVFSEETGFLREGQKDDMASAGMHRKPSTSWIRDRLATFFPGNRVVPPSAHGRLVSIFPTIPRTIHPCLASSLG